LDRRRLPNDKKEIIPSPSLDRLASSNTLSKGKVIVWQTPALAIGGLFLSLNNSDMSFLFLMMAEKWLKRRKKYNESLHHL
jgi:hypothetical protein